MPETELKNVGLLELRGFPFMFEVGKIRVTFHPKKDRNGEDEFIFAFSQKFIVCPQASHHFSS